MKLTKLQIVQRVLASVDSDEVSSISDTVESEQVATFVDSAYELVNSEQPWPHLRGFRNLEVSPVSHKMRIPSGVVTVDSVRYNKKDVEYKEPVDMQELLDRRDTALGNVDSNGAYSDRAPTYWTSTDDDYIIFDSYDASLVASLSLVDCYKLPGEMTNDTDFPDLPERFHQLIYFQALADAMYTLKGDTTGYNIYRRRYNLGLIRMRRWARIINKQRSTGREVNYGRRGLS